jgi:hypothetical protein
MPVRASLAGLRHSLAICMLATLVVVPEAHAQLNSKDALVIDYEAGMDKRGALFRVDSETGTRTLLSDFGSAELGPLGFNPLGVAVESSGQILLTDADAGTDFRGALFRVDPASGARKLLSDFGDAAMGPLGRGPFGVAVERSGQILVVDPDVGRGRLFRVNPETGARTILSDFGDEEKGPVGRDPIGVAVIPKAVVDVDWQRAPSVLRYTGLYF